MNVQAAFTFMSDWITGRFQERQLLITSFRTHPKAKGPFCVPQWTTDGGPKIALDSKSRPIEGDSEVAVARVTKLYSKGKIPIRFAVIEDLGSMLEEALAGKTLDSLEGSKIFRTTLNQKIHDAVIQLQVCVSLSPFHLGGQPLIPDSIKVSVDLQQTSTVKMEDKRSRNHNIKVNFFFSVKATSEIVKLLLDKQ